MLNIKKSNNFSGRPGPLLLIIMDGIGIGPKNDANAVYLAKTPHMDKFFSTKLYTQLKAHGRAVGLPSGNDMGNSEVGHNALGAGKVYDQGALLVDNALKNGKVFREKTWKKLVNQCLQKNSVFHFMGLLSDGNVHSHIDHLLILLNQVSADGVKKARVHILLDGRDVGERTALEYIAKLEAVLAKINSLENRDYRIASGGGRMVTTMDRYFADWEVVKRGWEAHVLGNARYFSSASEAISTMYEEDEKITDQYLPSFVITENDSPIGTITDNDSVLFYNFRGDRAIEISMAFENENFQYFKRTKYPNIEYAGIIQYDGNLHIPKQYLIGPPSIEKTISHYLCEENIHSFAISETQKFGHVTYFWNGNKSGYINKNLETYIEIPSDRIPFDQAPKMKAEEITQKTKELLLSGKYKFGRLNFANGDMVGHTGIMEAAITACETVDKCLGELVDTVNKLNGITVITADHGNSDEMFSLKDGKKIIRTAHTLNPVPFVILDSSYQEEYQMRNVPEAGLANIAATLCNLLGYEAPKEFNDSLIIPKPFSF
ncbi:2,3-bisphosphoglycerate-independent phosphoglycerate mutase [Candidatus Margulisiibacteriota bacterium]